MKEVLVQSAYPDRVRDVLQDVGAHVRYLNSLRNINRTGGGAVRQHVLWLVDGRSYVGEIRLRDRPSGRHPSIASHVYYEIRPSRRRRGYGTEILHMGMKKARALGWRNVIVSCAVSNTASKRIIERNGGRLLDRRRVPGERSVMLLYRISTRLQRLRPSKGGSNGRVHLSGSA